MIEIVIITYFYHYDIYIYMYSNGTYIVYTYVIRTCNVHMQTGPCVQEMAAPGSMGSSNSPGSHRPQRWLDALAKQTTNNIYETFIIDSLQPLFCKLYIYIIIYIYIAKLV